MSQLDIFWHYNHKDQITDFLTSYVHSNQSEVLTYKISVEISILVFQLEPYEMKFSYTVLRGGVIYPSYLSQ
jgi:hypothetical protein